MTEIKNTPYLNTFKASLIENVKILYSSILTIKFLIVNRSKSLTKDDPKVRCALSESTEKMCK